MANCFICGSEIEPDEDEHNLLELSIFYKTNELIKDCTNVEIYFCEEHYDFAKMKVNWILKKLMNHQLTFKETFSQYMERSHGDIWHDAKPTKEKKVSKKTKKKE